MVFNHNDFDVIFALSHKERPLAWSSAQHTGLVNQWSQVQVCSGSGSMFKRVFNHFMHFSSLAACLDMTLDVEMAVKPKSSIHPSFSKENKYS